MADGPGWSDGDAERVAVTFERLLRRAPSAEERAAHVAMVRAAGFENFVLALLESEEYRTAFPPAPFVPAGHFYSPIPSPADVDAVEASDWTPRSVPGIEIREEGQLELLGQLAAGYADLPFQAAPTPGLRYHYDNPNFSYSDAIFLSSMVRHLRPRRFIEVGSGDSSLVLLDTIDRFLPGEVDVTFIEPYPQYLRELLGDEASGIRLLEARLQDVDLREFESLEAGDVLFIDSTHVSKAASDVNHLFFEILPRLGPGVVVHIHDVFWPFEYPVDWLREGRAWNEQYLLRSFLQFNDAYEVLLFGHFMVTRHQAWFERNMPLCLRNGGGSMWLRRAG